MTDSGSATRHAATVLLLGASLPPPYGGIAKYLQEAVPFLARHGYRSHLVRPDPDVSASRLLRVTGEWDSVTVHEFSQPSRSVCMEFFARHAATLAPFLYRFWPAFVRSPRVTRQHLTTFLGWCVLAERVATSEHIDVVHAFDSPWSQGAAAVWASRRFGARAVVTTFGEVVPHRDELRQFDEFSSGFRRLSRYVLRSADVRTSMTLHCRDQVKHVGVCPETVRLVRFVVGMDRFSPGVDGSAARARYAPSGGPLLLFAGQVRARKGPQTLVEAMPAVLRVHPAAQLVIAGPDHGYAAALIERAERLGVANSVQLLGAIGEDELVTLYAAADVFLFSSLTPIECLGLTFVQAMFAGKPVVATRIGGAPEVIREGVDGWLVPPKDAEAFAERTLAILSLPAEARAQMGRHARDRVLTLFSEEDVLNDLLETYESIASREGST